jgi:hypothetical protein
VKDLLNKLALNLYNTNMIKSVTNNLPQHALSVGYSGKCIEESVSMKYLGLQIHNDLNWTNHIDKFISELSYLC